MAAPMREGAPAGGARPAPHTHPANFEYDDNEWDIGIGDLIIDLDADIEKTDEAGGMAARAEPDAQRTALKMKIKRTKPGTKSSEAKHEIVKSNETNGEPKPPLAPSNAIPIAAPVPAVKRGSGGHRRDKARDKHHHPHQPHEVNGVARTPSAPNAPGPPASANSLAPSPSQSASSKSEPRTPVPSASSRLETPKPATGSASATVPSQPAVPSGAAPTVPAPIPPPASPATKPEPDDSRQESATSQPPAKKVKLEPKETAEMCVGTSVGTITEPDCLGPCEPGTAVTLEGIVWHETEGGVLVVNVTWRGKTYVGTLLDCTRHDWAPPRFCDSPTEELDARTPKGRGAKRGRGAAPTDMTNFTETRSSVHSKLRNGGAKGRRALPSPTPFTPPRPDPKRKRTSEAEEQPPTPKAKRPPPTPTSPPPDPVLLECPEPNCSKKYKNAIGLKFHRSRAHGTPDDDDKDGSSSDTEETTIEPPSPARPPSEPAAPSTPSKSPVPTKSPIEDKDKSHEGSPEKTEEESPPTPRFEETPSANERPPSQPSTTPPTTPPANTQLPTQFKVKPRSALMPEEHKSESPTDENGKRRRRTPSPGVRSPAYSDISDDAAPPDGVPDDDTEHRPFNVYHQFYGQPSFIPSHPPAAVPPPPAEKNKDDSHKADPKTDLKESKPESVPQKPVLPQHFYPYNYVPNFPYNVEGNPPIEEKKDERSKTTPSPLDKNKQNKDIRPNDNHQILKESIEMKAQMSYPFQRPPHAREEDLRRFYMGERREPEGPLVNRAPPSKGPSKESKEIEIKPKAEGQKPTTETQGPPPPPTSQYYLPPFMSSPHFAALPFEPVYRVGPYATGWTPRFHAPEDLSRNNKDCLPHYAPHKIHELSEHAKGKPRPDAPQTPTPKERSPPPQRHVHTHHHTHVGLGYPLYPPPYPGGR